MRIVLVILSTAALLFMAGMALMLTRGGEPLFPNTPPTSPSNTPATLDGLAIETLKHQIKTEEKLNELQKRLDQLAGTNGTPAAPLDTHSDAPDSQSGSEIIVPISAKFLSKVLPTIEPKKVENSGIFDLRTFDHTPYTTYKDEKFGITVVASMLPYETIRKNFQAIDASVYTINETETFPFASFYVNPPKSDTTVRLVMQVEAQTLLVSMPKSKFNTFKELILKK